MVSITDVVFHVGLIHAGLKAQPPDVSLLLVRNLCHDSQDSLSPMPSPEQVCAKHKKRYPWIHICSCRNPSPAR